MAPPASVLAQRHGTSRGRDTGATFKGTFTGVANINIDDASVSLTASGSGLLPRARQVNEPRPLLRLC